MRQPLRVGIVGCGQIAEVHVNRYREAEGVSVVACAARHLSSSRSFAERHGIPEAYEDFEALLAQADVDLIDVCVHNALHAPVALRAIESGRHVYCEKPLAGKFADARRMVDAAGDRGVQLHVQLDCLFDPETRAAKALVDEKALGEVYHARSVGHRRRGRPFVDGYGRKEFVSRSCAGGGALCDTGVYELARILYLLDAPKPVSAVGQTYQRLDMPEQRRRESGFDVEEFAVGFVRFEGGLTLDVLESWAAHIDSPGCTCLLGTEGGLRFKPFRHFYSRAGLDLEAAADLAGAQLRWRSVAGGGSSFGDSQQHMLAALRGHVQALPTASVALAAMLVSDMLYLSSDLGREVRVHEVLGAEVGDSAR